MRALVTGFEPFGGERVNAACEAVRCLPARAAGLTIATAILPTSYAQSHLALEAAIARETPDLVLCTGQAGDRPALNVERIAVNLQDARLPDNDGAQPGEQPVIANGPSAYFSTLPVAAIVRALQKAGLPAEASLSAGSFVCNHVFYHLMRIAAASPRPLRAGFLHVPCLPGQVPDARPTLPAADIARGMVIALETTVAAIASTARA